MFFKSRTIFYILTNQLPDSVSFTTYTINMQKLEFKSKIETKPNVNGKFITFFFFFLKFYLKNIKKDLYYIY
jgi:hypothetical protein